MNLDKVRIICIFGFMATGKLSIGQKLHEKTKINFSHNHLLNGYIGSMFPHGTKERGPLIERYQIELLEKVAEAGVSLITTHSYASDYILHSGISDVEYVQKMEKIVNNYGVTFYGIHLLASDEIMISRVGNDSRKEFKKLVDVDVMKEVLKESSEQKSPDIRNLLKIDTGENTIDESVDMIINFINLK